MNAQKTQRVHLLIEELEPRYAPAYLTADPGAFSVAGLTFPGLDDGWNVQCQINMSTGSYLAPDGSPQVAVLDQYGEVLGPLQSPNEQDFQLLVNEFPDWNFKESPLQLADNSIQIKDYEALASGSGAPAGDVGASLLLQYNPTGVDPTQIDWIQFVSTDAPLGNDPPLVIDNAGADGMSPFYNRGGGTAGNTGFFDIPSRFIQNNSIQWHADLFVAQEGAPENGHRTVTIWGGISWGWQTVQLPIAPIVSISSSADSSEVGTPVTFSASVSTASADGNTPTGIVDFYSDGVLLGAGILDASGTASIAVTGLTVGTHDIQAVYSGDAKFTSGEASTSEVVTDSASQVATDSTNQVVTDSSNQVVTDSTNQVVTDSSNQVITDSTNQMVTSTTNQVVTDFTNQVVMGPTNQVVNQVVTGFTNEVVMDATNQVVADSTQPDMSLAVTLLNPGDQAKYTGDSVSSSLTASTSNGSALTYSATVLPPGLNTNNGTISGVIDPGAGSSTVFSVAASAMDAQGTSGAQDLSWTVP